ncbi:hypothetical protein FDF96_10680 [Clostridium botulinum]|nr:hypothetical protein [Clostridium botulinum]NFV20309.1 hypothetical protein [Clostridium botulinum]
MFTGFNLKIDEQSKDFLIKNYYDDGKEIFDGIKKDIKSELESYIGIDGCIDCTKLQDEWFPQLDNHIFLSHSHAYEDIAIGLAGWLNKNFGLDVFIDSCVWNYCDDLLRTLDNEYCLNDGGETYNYTSRNHTTTHVHMMLSTALNKMINKTECIIFLNTDNSILNTKDVVNTQTKSAWIYSEINTTMIVKRVIPDRLQEYLIEKKSLNEAYNKVPLKTKYDINLKHLFPLEFYELNKVCITKTNTSKDALDALDALYFLKGIDKKNF